ncbi:hypothetical protein [Paenibacillus sp. WLX2291]|uniref:hypothetical protein n=1 Tax=Paenibacillus sp. WLX2291 TaxID=3296934 RepID=UPI003983F8DF
MDFKYCKRDPFPEKQNDHLHYDTLSIELQVEKKRVYRNISKVKGKMVSVVDWKLLVYINGNKLAHDEILVVEEFFNTLLRPGIYPLFTCSCGIFGCGGYYVEVIHEGQNITWRTEQIPFEDPQLKTQSTFVFTRHHMTEVAESLRQDLAELRHITNAIID